MIAAMCVPEGFSFGSCSMAGRKKSATGISSVGATGVIRFRSILSSAASEVAADSRSDAQRGSLKVAACILGALLLREIGRELLCGIRPTQGAGTAFRGKGIGYSNARVHKSLVSPSHAPIGFTQSWQARRNREVPNERAA